MACGGMCHPCGSHMPLCHRALYKSVGLCVPGQSLHSRDWIPHVHNISRYCSVIYCTLRLCWAQRRWLASLTCHQSVMPHGKTKWPLANHTGLHWCLLSSLTSDWPHSRFTHTHQVGTSWCHMLQNSPCLQYAPHMQTFTLS